MILVLSNPRRKSCAAISKESSLSAIYSNRPGYECRCAFSAGLVDVLAETFVGDIHLAQSGQNFRCAGVEMVSDELLQLADRVLHLRRGRRKIFQLTQLCELSRQLGKITSRTVLFALLVFLIRGCAAPLFFDLSSKTCLLGLVKCVKIHRCHSYFQSLTGESDEFSKLLSPQLQQFDLVLQRGSLVKVRIIQDPFDILERKFQLPKQQNGLQPRQCCTVILFLVVSIALTAILLSLVHPIVVAMSTPTDAVSGMQHAAARKIDCGIGKAELPDKPAPQANAPAIVDFQPYMGKVRKPGTGCISQINDHLFEGRYSPTWIDGKKHARNVYAHTREECEEKLKVLIAEMKAELAELKRQKGDRH